jgi:hypothetical protein
MGSFSKLEWMDAVRQCTAISAERRIVIMHIGATADQFGNDAWRDNKTVADELRVAEKTVTRARDDATRHELWSETRPADNKHTARYRLRMPPTWVDSSVYPNGLGGTPESVWVDSTVRLGGLQSPLGGTPESTASGISSGSPSGCSSDPWGDIGLNRETAA